MERRRKGRHPTRAFGALHVALVCLFLVAGPVKAHGEITGAQDIVQDYGVLLFLVATILLGVGVLAWVTFGPQPDEAEVDRPAGSGRPGEREGDAITGGD